MNKLTLAIESNRAIKKPYIHRIIDGEFGEKKGAERRTLRHSSRYLREKEIYREVVEEIARRKRKTKIDGLCVYANTEYYLVISPYYFEANLELFGAPN